MKNFFSRFWLDRDLLQEVPASGLDASIPSVVFYLCGSLLVIICQKIGLFGISFSCPLVYCWGFQ